MTDSILQKYTARRVEDADANHSVDTDVLDDFGAFGWLRGIRDRALMLELRHKTGNITAIGYAWLERIEFNPSEGISLHTAGRTIRIRGRNLNAETRPHVRLFQGIVRHRVPWIQEADAAALVDSGGGTIVESISVS